MVSAAPPKKAIIWLALAWSSEKAVCASMLSPLHPKDALNTFRPSSDKRKRRFKAATASRILAAIIFHILFLDRFNVFRIGEVFDVTVTSISQQRF